MTTEDDFQSALDARLDDWHTRLVFADWLEERGDPRAAGYRALGTRRMTPSHGVNSRIGSELWWWTSIEQQVSTVPHDWFKLIRGLKPSDNLFKPRATGENTNTRREVEDAAALAFGKLPGPRQAELLVAPVVPAEPPARRKKPGRRKKGK